MTKQAHSTQKARPIAPREAAAGQHPPRAADQSAVGALDGLRQPLT